MGHASTKAGFLVLTRKMDQDIIIDHPDGPIVVRVVQLQGHEVRLGIHAPKSVMVDRSEVYHRKAAEGRRGDA